MVENALSLSSLSPREGRLFFRQYSFSFFFSLRERGEEGSFPSPPLLDSIKIPPCRIFFFFFLLRRRRFTRLFSSSLPLPPRGRWRGLLFLRDPLLFLAEGKGLPP